MTGTYKLQLQRKLHTGIKIQLNEYVH